MKCPTFLSDFNQILDFLDRVFFSWKYSISNFTKIRPVGVGLIHVDRRKGDDRRFLRVYERA